MKRRLKINGIIIFCIFLLIVTFPDIFFRNDKAAPFNTILEVLGISLILLGQIFRASGRGFKSQESGNGGLLIQGGPYALVRNPMYLGVLLIGAGIILTLFQWWTVFILLPVFTLRYFILIFEEEKKLSQAFSKDYQDYLKRVPRILPSLSAISKIDMAEYLPLKSSWIKKEIGSILAILLIVFSLKMWVGIKNKGPGAYVIKDAAAIILIIALFIGLVIYLNKRTLVQEKNVSDKSQVTL